MRPSSADGAARRILGIDPGSRATGYGVVEVTRARLSAGVWGVLKTPARASLPERLLDLDARLTELIAGTRPDVVAVEAVFFHRDARAAIVLAEARAIALLAAARAGLCVCEHAPRSVKAAVTGFGGAEKTQVAAMVRTLLGLGDRRGPADAFDALAVALTEAHAGSVRRLWEAGAGAQAASRRDGGAAGKASPSEAASPRAGAGAAPPRARAAATVRERLLSGGRRAATWKSR